FFQAEDGIRDFHVTGVQTCALPISQIIRSDFIICLIDIEIACNGTSSTLLNHPSPNCCWRHCKSRLTIRYASSTSKSAGGSLNRSEERRVGKKTSYRLGTEWLRIEG